MTISREVAEGEVNAWMDYRKVSTAKRVSLKDNIEKMVSSIEDGSLVLNEDKSLSYTLKFPIIGESKEKETPFKIETLTFTPRLQIGVVHRHLQGVKADDLGAFMSCYAAALTGQSKAMIGKLDTDDFEIVNAISGFFQ